MRTPPLTSRWSEQLHIQLQGSLEILSLILGGNTLNTNESVTKEEEKDGRRWVAALPSLFLQRQALWSSSPHCLCGPQCKTQCKHMPSPLPTDSRAFHVPRGALDPLYTPARPTTPRPFQKHEAPVPASSRPLIWAVSQPGMSSPPSQARTAEKLSGISPSLLCVLTKRVHSPRVKISCTFAACRALGEKDTLCSASRWISSVGEVCLSPGLGSGGAGVPPFPAQCPPAQVPGSRSAGLWLSTPQQGGGGPGRRDLGAQRGGGSGQGVSNMLYPPNTHPEEEARG